MVRQIADLAEIAGRFEAIVLDQWGVLHDGSAPYPGAVKAVAALARSGTRLAVLSNSGKRAEVNAARIAEIGFDPGLFETVMTSGEALWRDLQSGRVSAARLYPVERAPGDAAAFLRGLDVALTDRVGAADAVLLMGVPDDAATGAYDAVFAAARDAGLTVICTNPDRASPRAGGITVASPGALAHEFIARGGEVRFYGKPHVPVFRAVEAALDCAPGRLLMVGDSLEHDIAGGAAAGWATAFVRGGLHGAAFGAEGIAPTLARLARDEGAPMPDYTLRGLGGDHA